MGSKTFTASHQMIQLQEGKLRIVMTRTPAQYEIERKEGQLEFSDETPRQLVERLTSAGYQEMLLVGGHVIATLFLKENLIDEIFLTLEPKLFGVGLPLVAEELMDIPLKLLSSKQLNPQGTLLLHYAVGK
jgi:dihydrofolate reductase